MKFIELFTFYSKFVRGRQFIILSLSIFATFLETLGFLTLAPLLSYTGSEMPENESGSINILMDI